MGALATSKSTHIAVVVPMTGYCLSLAFCFFVVLQEWRLSGKMEQAVEEPMPTEEKLVLQSGANEIHGNSKLQYEYGEAKHRGERTLNS